MPLPGRSALRTSWPWGARPARRSRRSTRRWSCRRRPVPVPVPVSYSMRCSTRRCRSPRRGRSCRWLKTCDGVALHVGDRDERLGLLEQRLGPRRARCSSGRPSGCWPGTAGPSAAGGPRCRSPPGRWSELYGADDDLVAGRGVSGQRVGAVRSRAGCCSADDAGVQRRDVAVGGVGQPVGRALLQVGLHVAGGLAAVDVVHGEAEAVGLVDVEVEAGVVERLVGEGGVRRVGGDGGVAELGDVDDVAGAGDLALVVAVDDGGAAEDQVLLERGEDNLAPDLRA